MEQLGKSLLPLYARALDLPAGLVRRGLLTSRPTRCVWRTIRARTWSADNEFGLAPHSDTSFMTLLAQNAVPGLSIRLPNGSWLDAPSLPGSFLVNGGDLLRRWTNERFLATPHRVINRSGPGTLCHPVLHGLRLRLAHGMRADLPRRRTTRRATIPITYPEYMTWFRNRNYAAAVQGTRTGHQWAGCPIIDFAALDSNEAAIQHASWTQRSAALSASAISATSA